MYRKKIFVNGQEERTHEILENAARKYGARVFSKIRIADVLSTAV